MELWPWWLGALALATVTLGWWLTTGRPLGVSASWARLLGATADAQAEQLERAVATAPDAVEAAMRAATLAAFPELAAAAEAAEVANPPAPAPAIVLRPRLSRPTHLLFLASLGVGGLLAALVRGAFSLHTDLGPAFVRTFPSAWMGPVVLVLGGVCVGFGTRMAGGCTSGHGLSGVSRLQPASAVATAVFFGTGIAVALALKAVTP